MCATKIKIVCDAVVLYWCTIYFGERVLWRVYCWSLVLTDATIWIVRLWSWCISQSLIYYRHFLISYLKSSYRLLKVNASICVMERNVKLIPRVIIIIETVGANETFSGYFTLLRRWTNYVVLEPTDPRSLNKSYLIVPCPFGQLFIQILKMKLIWGKSNQL